MRLKIYTIVSILIGMFGCKSQKPINIYETDKLKIEQLTEHTFLHTSFLSTTNFGNVLCNGMIIIDDGEAIIFDTPVNDSTSAELINWIENTLKCRAIGVVVTHFHIDCLGGLKEFHNRQISSYANHHTIDLVKSDNVIPPQNGFYDNLELKVGNKKVMNEFIGEGHTKDNIVSYFPDEKILFGGCLIKAIGAGKGNLNDANVNDWSNTVENVKLRYNKAEIIIPGHGKVGGQDLLDYAIELFNNE